MQWPQQLVLGTDFSLGRLRSTIQPDADDGVGAAAPTTPDEALAAVLSSLDRWLDDLPNLRGLVERGTQAAMALWHVPAFVVVTGYLSRSFTWVRASVRVLNSIQVRRLS